MIRVALVRGRYFNLYEGQNFIFDRKQIKLTGFASCLPIHRQAPFPVVQLPSIADLQSHRWLDRIVKAISNRTLGDSHILFGLEKYSDQFDIFHTADPHYYYSFQLAKLRAQNKIKRLIVSSWETIPFNNESVPHKRFIKKYTQRQADLFICYSKKSKHCLIKENVPERKIKLIRLGVDLQKFKPHIYNLNRQSINILFVGRLVEEKGVMDLYLTYKNLNSEISKLGSSTIKLRLIIIGEGHLKKTLDQLIIKDNLKTSVEIKSVSYHNMPKVYQQADIFVLPSKTTRTWEEQYGMVLVEAMASGLPIVAYNSGAVSEVIDKAGLLVKEGNQHQLFDTIKQLIVNPSLRVKLGTMGRDRAERTFNSEKTAQEIAEIYHQILL